MNNGSQRPTKKRRVHVRRATTPEPRHESGHNTPINVEQFFEHKLGSPDRDDSSISCADEDDDEVGPREYMQILAELCAGDSGIEPVSMHYAEALTPDAVPPGRIRHSKKKYSTRGNFSTSTSAAVESRAANSNSNKGSLPSNTPPVPQLIRPKESTTGSSPYRRLYDMLSKLQEDNKSLRHQILSSEMLVWKTLHHVQCGSGSRKTTYSDAPILYGKRNHGHLQAQHIAEDVELFIAKQHGRVSFVVCQKYHCCGHKTEFCRKYEIETRRQGPSVFAPTGEEIQIESQNLSEALDLITERCDHGDGYYPDFQVGSVVKAPYFWYYHNRQELEDAASSLNKDQQAEFKLFQAYLSQNMGREYKEVDNMLSNGKITARYFDYLFCPETTLLQAGRDETTAFVEEKWPDTSISQFRLCDDDYQVINYSLSTDAWHWSFDGVFQRGTTRLSLKFATEDSEDEYLGFDEEIDIHSLAVYPLKFAKPGVESALREKGEKFWRCRHRNYVAYHGSDYRSEEINVRSRVSD